MKSRSVCHLPPPPPCHLRHIPVFAPVPTNASQGVPRAEHGGGAKVRALGGGRSAAGGLEKQLGVESPLVRIALVASLRRDFAGGGAWCCGGHLLLLLLSMLLAVAHSFAYLE